MAALLDRHEVTPRTVYDLTVSGLHTFYALAGSDPFLVHNCNDLIVDEGEFPGLANVLDEHVDPTEAEAFGPVASKGRPDGVFADLQTAQQVVDYAIADKAGEIARWLRGKKKQGKV
ncbi:RNase A-like domain-containing protein [Streptomyces shenzhenensis]|uniref:RNase A-like domain-containing protein n=1 Tax=Streptomyces shenzhenensis TaxID=943815 RepID=UPI002867D6F1|nr:RNase A-like domain-containing protein [Streptomyces shenzhenensis]